jgi:phage terminase large subunit-like protein
MLSPSSAKTNELVEILRLEEEELKYMEGLPHLYGPKWYPWAWEFFESRARMNFLCAANQISKSSTQIRKCIDWATDKSKWKELWPTDPKPNQFWYLYPTANQCSIEFETKWQQFLPAKEFKNHPEFGWREEWKNKEIFALYFNSGVTVYFKSYKQGAEALQTGSVYAVFLDEECPEDLWDELTMRVAATNGYIHMVFTATIGQELWRQCIEPTDQEDEKFPGAWKRQVSMYDCQKYLDGTLSKWTNERISQVIATCKSHQEVLRRVYGKFIKESGLKYPTFDIRRHFKKGHPLKGWNVYSAVDIGSGGQDNHPAGIVFLAVDPTYRMGRVIAAWRGDGIVTTPSDILIQYQKMKKDMGIQPVAQLYDWASIEFFTIASRNGESFQRANKSHEDGERTLNTLFKNDMLIIYEDTDGETIKLASELSSLREGQNKRKAKDDLVDPLRYITVAVPWDWSVITGEVPVGGPIKQENLTPHQREVKERREAFEKGHKDEEDYIQSEFDEWNSEYGA